MLQKPYGVLLITKAITTTNFFFVIRECRNCKFEIRVTAMQEHTRKALVAFIIFQY